MNLSHSTNPPNTPIAPNTQGPHVASARIRLFDMARGALFPVGTVAAGCLMLAFVQLCNESVARGERWRAEQRALTERVTVVGQVSAPLDASLR